MTPPKKFILLFILFIIILLSSKIILSEEAIDENIVTEETIDENTEIITEEITETQENTIDNNETEEDNELEAFYVNIDNIDENPLEHLETELINDSEEINETEINDSIEINDTAEVNETEINDSVEINETEEINETIEEPEEIINETEPIEEVIEEPEEMLTLKVNKPEYKAGEPVTIYVDAPKDSDINLFVSNGMQEYAYFYTDEVYPSTFKFPLTDTEGIYTVKAILYLPEDKEIKEVTFIVLPNEKEKQLEASIDAPNEVNVGERVVFNAVVWGAAAPEYEWDFEDDSSTSNSKTTSHIFENAGIFKVKLTAKDNENTAEDTLLVHVSPNKNKLIVKVKDSKNKYIPEAKVTINDMTSYTNSEGMAEFMLPKGTHILQIGKEGYIPYRAEEEIKNYKLAIIKLENKIDVVEKIGVLKNKVKEVTILDKSGNIVESVDYEDTVLDMLLKTNKGNVIVSIKDFRSLNANWDNIDKISIETENKELSKAVDEQGFITKDSVSIENIDYFTEEYDGIVSFDISNIEFNTVLYCNDNYECSKIDECLTGIGKEACYTIKESILMVYVPHFSSIVLALDNETAEIEITSPEETTGTGENLYLTFTVNESVTARYSLDGGEFIELNDGEFGTEFSILLEGDLEREILANGDHNITIKITDEHNNSNSTLYLFTVDDLFPPIIGLLHEGVELDNKIINSQDSDQILTLISDEYAYVSYKINDNEFIDLNISDNNTFEFEVALQNGTNNITINATDMHNNSAFTQYDFQFIQNISSCSDGMQNGDETGIDCGGSCPACIKFNVTTDKTIYNETENVKATIVSRADSEVNLTVKLEGEVVYDEYITSYSPGYPIYVITTLENTDTPGDYTIEATMYYMQITETITKTFEVVAIEQSNPLQVSIIPNATSIKAGETIAFNSSVSGQTGSLSYKWDFTNDKTTDSTSASTTNTYEVEGDYTVNFTVNDGTWEKSATSSINVKKAYNVSVTVKNNETDALIENAEVELHNQIQNTSSTGKISFKIEQGEYTLTVKKPDFVSNSQTLNVDSNKEITVTIKERDSKVPVIEIISPKDEVINSNSVALIFKAYDDTTMNCKILVNTFDEWWNLEHTHYNVASDSEQSYSYENLENKDYRWKVECTDNYGNTGYSGESKFTVSNGENTILYEESEQSEDDATIEALISQIDAAIQNIESLGSLEKEAASLMDLRNILEKAKTNINRAKRDLSNMVWRRLEGEEEEAAIKEIYDRIEEIKKTTPINIKVIENNEFVKYPSKQEIENATSEILNFDNIRPKSSERKQILKKIEELQSAVTITTKYKVLDADYLSGDKGFITLIQKEITSKDSIAGLNLVEMVPKTIAEDIDDMSVLFQTEVINPDPMIRVDLEKIDNLVYYVNKNVNNAEIQKTNSVIFPKDMDKEDLIKVTGFAALKNFGSNFIENSNKRLVIEIAVIIVLGLIYLAYSLDGFKKLRYVFKNKEVANKLKEINNFIDESFNQLKEGKYENAKRLYSEINVKFKELHSDERKNIYKKITKLANKLDFYYLDKLTDDAFNYIENNQKVKAASLYESIKKLYKGLAKEEKAIVLTRCNQLYKKLSAAK